MISDMQQHPGILVADKLSLVNLGQDQLGLCLTSINLSVELFNHKVIMSIEVEKVNLFSQIFDS